MIKYCSIRGRGEDVWWSRGFGEQYGSRAMALETAASAIVIENGSSLSNRLNMMTSIPTSPKTRASEAPRAKRESSELTIQIFKIRGRRIVPIQMSPFIKNKNISCMLSLQYKKIYKRLWRSRAQEQASSIKNMSLNVPAALHIHQQRRAYDSYINIIKFNCYTNNITNISKKNIH